MNNMTTVQKAALALFKDQSLMNLKLYRASNIEYKEDNPGLEQFSNQVVDLAIEYHQIYNSMKLSKPS